MAKAVAVLAILGLAAAGLLRRQGLVGGADAVMPAVVTLLVLGAPLYVILSKKYGEADLKWAYAAIGTILGYWLRVGQGA